MLFWEEISRGFMDCGRWAPALSMDHVSGERSKIFFFFKKKKENFDFSPHPLFFFSFSADFEEEA